MAYPSVSAQTIVLVELIMSSDGVTVLSSLNVAIEVWSVVRIAVVCVVIVVYC